MIKFFRKIRKKFLINNKINKYLIYVSGEILLVVIGILIALQINNWNEQKKNYKTETTYLKNLNKELTSSLIELKGDYNANMEFLKSTLNILKYLDTKPNLVDSMYIDFYNSVSFNYFYPNKSTYESLKTGELKLIKSDSLRYLITNVYESAFQRVLEKTRTRRNASSVLFPYYQKHFRTISRLDLNNTSEFLNLITSDGPKLGVTSQIINHGKPNDYEQLLNDPEYSTLISEALVGRTMAIQDLRSTIILVEDCLKEIEKYLQK